MGLLGWLDDSQNPTLWITAIYPLLILLLALACHFKMQHLIESFPLALDDSAGTKENEPSDAGDSSPADYDMISPDPADNATAEAGQLDRPSPATETPDTRVVSHKNESATPRSVKQATKSLSRHTHLEYLKGVLIYGLQVLLAHRLGVLATSKVQESHSFAAKIIGLLSLSFVTLLVLISTGNLGRSRAVALWGYRTRGGQEIVSDQSDPWTIFVFLSFLTLVVPWFRLLFSFIW